MQMLKRERRLTKNEQRDRILKVNVAKGLRGAKNAQDVDDSDGSYHTVISEDELKEPYIQSDDSEKSDVKDEELVDIF